MECINNTCVCIQDCNIRDIAEYCIIHKKYCALYGNDINSIKLNELMKHSDEKVSV